MRYSQEEPIEAQEDKYTKRETFILDSGCSSLPLPCQGLVINFSATLQVSPKQQTTIMVPRVKFGKVEVIPVHLSLPHPGHSTDEAEVLCNQIVSVDFYETCRDVQHIRRQLDEREVLRQARLRELTPPPPSTRLGTFVRPRRERQRSHSLSPVRNPPCLDSLPKMPVRRALSDPPTTSQLPTEDSDSVASVRTSASILGDQPPALPNSCRGLGGGAFNARGHSSLSPSRSRNSSRRFQQALKSSSTQHSTTCSDLSSSRNDFDARALPAVATFD